MRARYILLAAGCLPLLFSAGDKSVKPGTELPAAVELQMRNVSLHLDSSTVLEVRSLRGRMTSSGEGHLITLDDVNSYQVRIDAAEIAVSTHTISDLLNNHVFAYPGAPLKHIEVTASNGMIKQTGVMHKGIDLPFEIEGPLDVSPEGEIRLHAAKIRSAHLPFKGLLHLFGEDLSKVINLKQDRGVKLEGDNILLNPSRMLPPPHIIGRVAAVRLDGDRIIETFESKPARPLSPPYKAANYIYHRGGVLRFGKLTMHDADLEIVDSSPGSLFDFSLPEYNRQLVAGYSKNTPDHGLIVFMPDLASLSRSRQHAAPDAPPPPRDTAPLQKSKSR